MYLSALLLSAAFVPPAEVIKSPGVPELKSTYKAGQSLTPGAPPVGDQLSGPGNFIFYFFDKYDGPVTWDIAGGEFVTMIPMGKKDYPLGFPGLHEGEAEVPVAPHVLPSDSVYAVFYRKPGTVTATAWGIIDGKPAKLASRIIAVGGARPPPGPVDPVTPVKVESFRVIFCKESGSTLNAQQAAIPTAKTVRDYLNAKTTAEGGQSGWREYDPQQNTTNEQPTMKALWDAVKPKITAVPCLIVEVNGKVDILPYPKDTADALKTLKQYGGQ